MAGDWLKMRTNLWDDPRVSRLCDLVGRTEAAVIGGLYWLWSTADQHSADGTLPGYTLQQIDRKVGLKGFAAGLVSVGWLEETQDGVAIPRFADHNGASAKARALTARRVANHKGKPGNGNGGGVSAALPERKHGVSDALPREEKRREELLTPGESEVDTSSRATRLPHHWSPGSDLLDWTRQERREWTPERIEHERCQFVDHFGSTGERRADWDAAWRKWIRGSRDEADQRHRKTRRIDPEAMDLLLGNSNARQ